MVGIANYCRALIRLVKEECKGPTPSNNAQVRMVG
jgi:hypothetical protein